MVWPTLGSRMTKDQNRHKMVKIVVVIMTAYVVKVTVKLMS